MTRTYSLISLAWMSLGFAIGALASPGQTVADEEVEAQQQAQYQELDRYLDRQVNEADRQRARSWQRNFSSIEDYEKSVEPWRAKLFELLGGNSYPNSPLRPQEQLIAEFPTHKAYRVRLTAFEEVRTYGILLVPAGRGPFPALICVHGMAGTPEGVCGLTAKADYHNRFGLQAAQRGFLVFAPLDITARRSESGWIRKRSSSGNDFRRSNNSS